MNFAKIILRSLQQHLFSTLLALFSIALGIALLVAVFSLREQTQRTFTQVGLGVDAILAPKGSPLQIVLNAIYHLEDMPGKIKWTYFKEVQKDPLVMEAVPFCVGHSYRGFRVNAIDRNFLTHFEYLPGKCFSFSAQEGGQGRPFRALDEAVAGWEAAKTLKIKLGDKFNPVCGVQEGDPVHEKDTLHFVGILAPTGTPHDRAIYMPLEAFYTLSGHPPETIAMAKDEEYREISGAYLKIKRIRGGALHPGIQGLKFAINQSDRNQLVIPNEVLPRLFDIIGWVDQVLLTIAGTLTILSALFLFFALISALNERRRDLALLRLIGASRKTVMGLVLAEGIFISFIGSALGLALGHCLVGISAHLIKIKTGIAFTAAYFSLAEWFVIPGGIFLGLLASLVPGFRAYRLGVLKNLSPFS